MPAEAVGIVLAAGSGNWRTQSVQFLQLVVLAVKQRLVYRTRARAVGVTDCRINDTDASLRIR